MSILHRVSCKMLYLSLIMVAFVCLCESIQHFANVTSFFQNTYWSTTAAAAKSRQSCLTLCNSIDSSPPGSSVPGILRARTLEWVAISFSNAWKWKVKVKSLSCVRLFVTPWIIAYQAPPSMGFPRQEYWSGVPSPSLTGLLSLFKYT